MANIRVKMEGINSIIKDLDKKGKSIVPAIKKGLTKTTNQCKAKAKENCPVDTGLLRESIHSEIKEKYNQVEGEVSTNIEYAPYVEFGTGRIGKESNKNVEVDVSYRADWQGQSAQPYMYPAYTDTREKLTPNIEKEMKKILKGANK